MHTAGNISFSKRHAVDPCAKFVTMHEPRECISNREKRRFLLGRFAYLIYICTSMRTYNSHHFSDIHNISVLVKDKELN